MASKPRRRGSSRGRRLHQVLPRDCWDLLIDAAGTDRGQPLIAARDQAIVAVLLFSGLRCGELVALDVGDVETREVEAEGETVTRWRLQVRHGKGDKHRTPALGAEGADFLEAYLDVRPELEGEEQPLFVSRKQGRLDESAVWRLVRAAGIRASEIGGDLPSPVKGLLTRLHPHDLRHSFATEAVRQASRKGKNLMDVAEQLGHADLDTTRIYYAASDEDRQDLVSDL